MTDNIMAAVTRGRARIAASQAEAAARVAAEDAARDEDWQTFLANLHGAGLPDWALEYVQRPDYGDWEPRSQRRHSGRVIIALPGCAPLWVHLAGSLGIVGYEGLDPLRVLYEDVSGEWFVDHDWRNLGSDFDLAVAQVAEWGGSYDAMTTEAARRNTERLTPRPVPTRTPLRQQLASLDPAAKLLDILDDLDHGDLASAPLWAALSIGTELRGIRTALEGIAAALAAPADDDPTIEE